MNLSVVIIVCSFTFFHFNQLIGKGRTTIEFCEEGKNTFYDVGFWKNFKNSMGSNPLFWCLPIGGNTSGSGVTFERASKGESDEQENEALNRD